MHGRALLIFAAFASFGSFVACGGRAYSLDDVVLPCEGDPECVPEAKLPETFTVLELRQIGDVSEPVARDSACEYESRIKVNVEQRLMIVGTCASDGRGSLAIDSANVRLTDADITLIQGAYADLRLSDAELCTSAPALMTLDLSTDNRPEPELRLADDDHSGCDLSHLEQRSFVSGLDEFRAVLLSLRDR